MQRVVIASKNPVKIAAVQTAFTKVFPNQEFEFHGISVPSGVADQPMTSQETYLGAVNRAENAWVQDTNANYWVGIEGGVESVQDSLHCFAWVVIKSQGKLGKSQTSVFQLPQRVAELVLGGTELGVADDIVFKRSNSKQQSGAVGLLTKDLITRTTYYVEATILALIPFVNEELY